MPTVDGLNTIQDNYEKYKDMFTTEKNDVVTMESFYQLLVAEMQNQDPLEPTSNTEFISQMATFTSLQATQDNFAMQQQNYARNLVGQYVGVTDGGSELVQGVVEYATFGDEVMIRVNGKNYPLSALKMTYGSTENGGVSQIGQYGAFASSLIGKNVVVQAIDAAGSPVYDEGKAESIEIQDGVVRVVVNGYAYNVTDVVSVSEIAQETAKPTADTNAYTLEQAVQDIISGVEQKTEAAKTEEIAEIPAVDETADSDIADLNDEEEETASLYELFQ